MLVMRYSISSSKKKARSGKNLPSCPRGHDHVPLTAGRAQAAKENDSLAFRSYRRRAPISASGWQISKSTEKPRRVGKLGEQHPSESSRSMKRILVSECKQEISSFNPLLGEYEDFTVHHGAQIVSLHRNLGSEMAGALAVFATHPYIE